MIQNMPMVMIKPMLEIPTCGEKANPPKLEEVVSAPKNMALAVLDS